MQKTHVHPLRFLLIFVLVLTLCSMLVFPVSADDASGTTSKPAEADPEISSLPVTNDDGYPLVVNTEPFEPDPLTIQEIPWIWRESGLGVDHSGSGFQSTYLSTYPALNVVDWLNPKHIVLDANTANFFGYYSNDHLDSLYYPEPLPGEQTIQFSIEAADVSYHAMHAFGFFINAEASGNLLDGVLVTFTGYRNGSSNTSPSYITAVTAWAMNGLPIGADGANNNLGDPYFLLSNLNSNSETVKLDEIIYPGPAPNYPGSFSVDAVADGDSLSITVNGDVLIDTQSLSTDYASAFPVGYDGGSGFGFYGAYLNSGHNCDDLSYVEFSNLEVRSPSLWKFADLNVQFIDIDSKELISKNYIRADYPYQGYVGQEYTVYPPDRIGGYWNFVEANVDLQDIYLESNTPQIILYYQLVKEQELSKEASIYQANTSGTDDDDDEDISANNPQTGSDISATNPRTGSSSNNIFIPFIILTALILTFAVNKFISHYSRKS